MANPVVRGLENFLNTLDQKLEKDVKNHLKSVYTTLALCLGIAAVGSYVHVCTEILKGSFFNVVRFHCFVTFVVRHAG